MLVVVLIVVKRSRGEPALLHILCKEDKESLNTKQKPTVFGGFDGGVKWARTIDLYDVNVTL